MKKFFSALVLISFLGLILMPAITSAVTIVSPETCIMGRALKLGEIDCGVKGTSIDIGDKDKGICCVFNTIYNVTDWIFIALVVVASLMVIIGAFTLLTAAGDPEKVAKGRNYILYAVVGLAVGLLAKAVPGIIKLIGGV